MVYRRLINWISYDTVSVCYSDRVCRRSNRPGCCHPVRLPGSTTCRLAAITRRAAFPIWTALPLRLAKFDAVRLGIGVLAAGTTSEVPHGVSDSTAIVPAGLTTSVGRSVVFETSFAEDSGVVVREEHLRAHRPHEFWRPAMSAMNVVAVHEHLQDRPQESHDHVDCDD